MLVLLFMPPLIKYSAWNNLVSSNQQSSSCRVSGFYGETRESDYCTLQHLVAWLAITSRMFGQQVPSKHGKFMCLQGILSEGRDSVSLPDIL